MVKMRVFILFLGLILFFQVSFANDFSLVDPKLIKISKTKEINKRKFYSKISKDNAIYKKNSANLNKEQVLIKELSVQFVWYLFFLILCV